MTSTSTFLVFLSVSTFIPSILNAADTQTQTTHSGAVFTRKTNLEENVNGKKTLWQDPTGLIWGDTLNISEFAELTHVDNVELNEITGWDVPIAENHCKAIGGRFPTAAEAISLREMLGAATNIDESDLNAWESDAEQVIDGYDPQILSDLNKQYIWTSTYDSTWFGNKRFDGRTGHLVAHRLINSLCGTGLAQVRCVFLDPTSQSEKISSSASEGVSREL